MMKQPNLSAHALVVLLILHSLLLCVVFFLSTANETTSAAALAATTNVDTHSAEQTTTQTKQEDQQGNYEKALELHDEFAKVMGGSEEVQCDDAGDDEEAECMKRRVMSEAHLDYIYTQHHKP